MASMTPSWKIVNAVQGQQLGQSGQYVKGWSVTYQLANGSSGTVFVPGDTLSTDAVKQAATDAAGQLAAVLSLTSDT